MSYYFSNFSNVDFDDAKYKNIYRTIDIDEILSDIQDKYTYYTLNDNDTPETLAYQFYESKEYYWVILLANNFTDYLYDLPLSDEEIRILAVKFYDSGRYETGKSVDEIYVELKEENDRKKRITLLKPPFIKELSERIERLGL